MESCLNSPPDCSVTDKKTLRQSSGCQLTAAGAYDFRVLHGLSFYHNFLERQKVFLDNMFRWRIPISAAMAHQFPQGGNRLQWQKSQTDVLEQMQWVCRLVWFPYKRCTTRKVPHTYLIVNYLYVSTQPFGFKGEDMFPVFNLHQSWSASMISHSANKNCNTCTYLIFLKTRRITRKNYLLAFQMNRVSFLPISIKCYQATSHHECWFNVSVVTSSSKQKQNRLTMIRIYDILVLTANVLQGIPCFKWPIKKRKERCRNCGHLALLNTVKI